ncbi:6-bladed beta-propeller [Parabacteroides pacaensis]|uniref:6-bladed beta-propeller n=1 Tax=Parabacteroides pacaensis TaxID=2086575 RepID=UPI000D0F15B2|nr:6-bladed beta-propeller [Parabacteroides pacaensis]
MREKNYLFYEKQKMRYKYCLIVNLAFFLLGGCGESKENKQACENRKVTYIQVKSDWKIKDGVKISTFVKNATFVPLELTNESLLREIGKVERHGDYIYVIESFRPKAIYQFTSAGKYIRKIACLGQGPEDFTELSDICVNEENGHIYVYDNGRTLIMEFTPEGKLVKTIHTGYYAESFQYKDGLFYMYSYSPVYGSSLYKIYITDQEGKKVKEYIPSKKISIGFETSGYTKTSQDILCHESMNDTVYSVSKDQLQLKYIFDFGEFTMPEEAKREYIHILIEDRNWEKRKPFLENYILGVREVWETDNWILFSCVKKYVTFYGLYNKKTSHLEMQPAFSDDMYYLYQMNVVSQQGNCFIAVADANALSYRVNEDIPQRMKKGKIDSQKGKKIMKRIQQILPEGEEEINPVLIFYELK